MRTAFAILLVAASFSAAPAYADDVCVVQSKNKPGIFAVVIDSVTSVVKRSGKGNGQSSGPPSVAIMSGSNIGVRTNTGVRKIGSVTGGIGMVGNVTVQAPAAGGEAQMGKQGFLVSVGCTAKQAAMGIVHLFDEIRKTPGKILSFFGKLIPGGKK